MKDAPTAVSSSTVRRHASKVRFISLPILSLEPPFHNITASRRVPRWPSYRTSTVPSGRTGCSDAGSCLNPTGMVDWHFPLLSVDVSDYYLRMKVQVRELGCYIQSTLSPLRGWDMYCSTPYCRRVIEYTTGQLKKLA